MTQEIPTGVYRVKHNMSVYRPRTWGKRYQTLFGERNEGGTVYASSVPEAIAVFADFYNVNPTYLTAEFEREFEGV